MSIGNEIWKQIQDEKGNISHMADGTFMLEESRHHTLLRIRYQTKTNLAIRLNYIRIQKTVPPGSQIDINNLLKEQASFIENTISYLLENFKTVEHDSLNRKVQMRSYEPLLSQNDRFFYEIILDSGTEISFERMTYSDSSNRYKKHYADLTSEVFCRLMDDLLNLPGITP